MHAWKDHDIYVKKSVYTLYICVMEYIEIFGIIMFPFSMQFHEENIFSLLFSSWNFIENWNIYIPTFLYIYHGSSKMPSRTISGRKHFLEYSFQNNWSYYSVEYIYIYILDNMYDNWIIFSIVLWRGFLIQCAILLNNISS